MKKVILRTGICFVFLLTLFISSGILSVKAEASHQTRTTTLDLSAAADSVKNAQEGWEWVDNKDDTYTLILSDFTLETSDSEGIILPRDHDVRIILQGQNTVTCTRTGLLENWVSLGPGRYKTKTIEGEGSLILHVPNGINIDRLIINSGTLKVYADSAFLGGLTTNEAYIQNGGNVYVSSTALDSDGLYLVGEMQLHDGSLHIEAKNGIGIFTDDASSVYNGILIDGGSLFIEAKRGIYRNRRMNVDAALMLSNADVSIHATDTAFINKEGEIHIHDITSWDVTAPTLFGGKYSLTLDLADYQEVDEQLLKVHMLQESLYTSASWKALQDSVNRVTRDKYFFEQQKVDAMLQDIKTHMDQLVYLPANYKKINEALQRIPSDKEIEAYTDTSRMDVYNLVSSIPWDKNITEQSSLDSYAARLNTAIDHLTLKPKPEQKKLQLLGGAHQRIRQGEAAVFQTNGSEPDIVKVTINGRELPAPYYRVNYTQTLSLTLQPEYTKQLRPGLYSISIQLDRENIETDFTVLSVSERGTGQQEISKLKHPASINTGDTTNTVLWLGIIILAVLLMKGINKYKYK